MRISNKLEEKKRLTSPQGRQRKRKVEGDKEKKIKESCIM